MDKLPERLRETVADKMRRAYHATSALEAEAQLNTLAHELERTHPGAAASLREGLAETLTVLALEVPPTLARTLRSTNAIESMIEICRNHSRNVKRWQDGAMVVRWWRRRHARSEEAVSARQRPSAPARITRRARPTRQHRNPLQRRHGVTIDRHRSSTDFGSAP